MRQGRVTCQPASSVLAVATGSANNHPSDASPWTRRGFLLTAAALAVVPGVPADPAVAAAELPDFPADVALYHSAYRNWVGEITADGLWACAPDGPDQVVAVVNWAWGHGWRVRARGASHGWSPLTVTEGRRPGRRSSSSTPHPISPAWPWTPGPPGRGTNGSAAAGRRPAHTG